MDRRRRQIAEIPRLGSWRRTARQATSHLSKRRRWSLPRANMFAVAAKVSAVVAPRRLPSAARRAAQRPPLAPPRAPPRRHRRQRRQGRRSDGAAARDARREQTRHGLRVGRASRPPGEMRVSDKHFVLGNSISPFPDLGETRVFATGCFWGTEKMYQASPVAYSGSGASVDGFTQNPTYEERAAVAPDTLRRCRRSGIHRHLPRRPLAMHGPCFFQGSHPGQPQGGHGHQYRWHRPRHRVAVRDGQGLRQVLFLPRRRGTQRRHHHRDQRSGRQDRLKSQRITISRAATPASQTVIVKLRRAHRRPVRTRRGSRRTARS